MLGCNKAAMVSNVYPFYTCMLSKYYVDIYIFIDIRAYMLVINAQVDIVNESRFMTSCLSTYTCCSSWFGVVGDCLGRPILV